MGRVHECFDEAGNAYPIPLRVLSFEQAYAMRDRKGHLGRVENYAKKLAEGHAERLRRAEAAVRGAGDEGQGDAAPADSADAELAEVPADVETEEPGIDHVEDGVDLDALYRQAAIEYFRTDEEAQRWFRDRSEAPWMAVQSSLMRGLPEDAVADPNSWAFELVTAALDEVFGPSQWDTEKRPKRDDPARNVTWVVLTNR